MKLLPSGRHTEAAPDITVIDEETWAVLSDRDTLGYVLKAGLVYVALSGADSSHAVEVGQSLLFDEAVRMVARG